MNQAIDTFYSFGAKARIAVVDDNQLLEGWRALDDADVRAAFEAQRKAKRERNKAALIALLKA